MGIKSENNSNVGVKNEKVMASSSTDDDDCMIIDAPVINNAPAFAGEAMMDEDGMEVLDVRGMGSMKLPHSRSDCTLHKFSMVESLITHSASTSLDTMANAKFCELCYCYVCDVLAGESPSPSAMIPMIIPNLVLFELFTLQPNARIGVLIAMPRIISPDGKLLVT